jgi:tetratricopeptide (TPR) repeat protein
MEVHSRPENVLQAADSLAKQLTSDAHAYATPSEQAVRRYYQARDASQIEEQRQHLREAIAADPDFGAAHLGLVQSYLSTGNRDQALQALEASTAHNGKFQPGTRARLNMVRASLAGDRAEQTTALREVAREAGADVDAWRTLADLELVNKNFPEAVRAYERASELEPGNLMTWNSLGYARAYAGDLKGAVEALEQYRRLAPLDANAIDSLGDVHFYLGHFSEAEKYYLDAHRINSALLGGGDLYRAAVARLLAGDVQEADKHFGGYMQLRQSLGDSVAPVRQAVWWWSTGRRRQAVASLKKLAAGTDTVPDVAALAWTQLAIWSLNDGRLNEAKPQAQQAMTLARSPVTKTLAWAASSICSGSVNPKSPVNIFGYFLLLTKRFSEAVPLWQNIYANTSANTAVESRVLLAWSLIETGKAAQAEELLRGWPLPGLGAEPGFFAVIFPRYLELRSRAGTDSDARRAGELYRRFSSQ